MSKRNTKKSKTRKADADPVARLVSLRSKRSKAADARADATLDAMRAAMGGN